MRMKLTPENRITALCVSATSDKLDWWRNPSGCAPMPSGVQMRFGLGGLLGSPDWIAIERPPSKHPGRAWFVEFKAPGKKPDLLQIHKLILARDYCPQACRHAVCHVVHQELALMRARASGAVAMFVDCVEDITRELSK
jgi:hypothetical protein